MRWLFLCLIFLSFPALATTGKIAAVIGNEIISLHDIQERLKIAKAASGLDTAPSPKDNYLLPRIVQGTVDEAIYRQHAKELGIQVSEKELQQAIRNLEVQKKQKKGEFEQFLSEKGLEKRAVLQQLEAQILWSKIVKHKIRPSIQVTIQETEDLLERLGKKSGVMLGLKQIQVPVEQEIPVSVQIDALQSHRIALKSCADVDTVAKDVGSTTPSSLMKVALSDLDIPVQKKLRDLNVREVSPVLHVNDTLQLFMICFKETAEPTEADREKIRETLRQRKLALESKHYLERLRKEIFTEIRL